MLIGPHALPNRLFVAPMAGVTDRPFRQLCRRLGAGYAVSEMVTSRKELWSSLKTSRRADHTGEPGPIAVQIAGTDAAMMAEAAAYNIDRGAQIIDINMGCPAKKVCNKYAGSALMRDEPLALAIVEAVVAVCAPRGVPVTLSVQSASTHRYVSEPPDTLDRPDAADAPVLLRSLPEAAAAVIGRLRPRAPGGLPP
jgi:tRNA-dihydrouridine synthase B